MAEPENDSPVESHSNSPQATMTAQEKLRYILLSLPFTTTKECSKYQKIKKIGQGTFGEVWKAMNKRTQEFVAMKRIITDDSAEGFPRIALREIGILKAVKNENIVQLKEVIAAQKLNDEGIYQNHYYLVFEFCEFDLAGLFATQGLSLSLAEIKALIKQLLLALYYLHRNNMIHRDMKSSNVLVNKEGILKVADFGLSRPYREKEEKSVKALTNRVVTLWYRPPELLLGDHFYTSKIDMWSAGCIMAEMWTRSPILPGSNEPSQLNLIMALCGSISTNVWPDVVDMPLFSKLNFPEGYPRRVIKDLQPRIRHELACDLLDKLLTLDPKKRLDADSALDHDFFFTKPMPAEASVLKRTLSKIHSERYEYITSGRSMAEQRQQQQQQQQQLNQRKRPLQQLQQPHQQHPQHQHKRPAVHPQQHQQKRPAVHPQQHQQKHHHQQTRPPMQLQQHQHQQKRPPMQLLHQYQYRPQPLQKRQVRVEDSFEDTYCDRIY